MATEFHHAELQTSAGGVAVQSLGNAGAEMHFVALPGMGRVGNPDWKPVVTRLVESLPMRATLPDPSSNRKTASSLTEFAVVRMATTLFGLIKYPLHEAWLLDVLPTENNGKVVLAGHSWGGGAACRFAAAHPERISRLVLVSPDVESTVAQQTFSTPTLLIWNKNDAINPYFWRRRFKGHPLLTLHTTTKGGAGGHMVLEEHAEVIAEWLRTPLENVESPAYENQ